MPSSSSTRTARRPWPRASRAWPRWSTTTSWARRASAWSACAPSPRPSQQQLGDAALVHDADQAAQLAKTDLVTDMVGEFPELQGIMGGYYALNDGLGETVAHAIEDHYKPALCGRPLPRNTGGRGGGPGRQARNPGRHVRHRQPAHGRPRPVRAAPPCAGRDPHAGREGPAAGL